MYLMSKKLHSKEEDCFIKCCFQVFLDLFSKNIVTRKEFLLCYCKLFYFIIYITHKQGIKKPLFRCKYYYSYHKVISNNNTRYCKKYENQETSCKSKLISDS